MSGLLNQRGLCDECLNYGPNIKRHGVAQMMGVGVHRRGSVRDRGERVPLGREAYSGKNYYSV